jgi:hypothetical protein
MIVTVGWPILGLKLIAQEQNGKKKQQTASRHEVTHLISLIARY